jgi:hypothetical protein
MSNAPDDAILARESSIARIKVALAMAESSRDIYLAGFILCMDPRNDRADVLRLQTKRARELGLDIEGEARPN